MSPEEAHHKMKRMKRKMEKEKGVEKGVEREEGVGGRRNRMNKCGSTKIVKAHRLSSQKNLSLRDFLVILFFFFYLRILSLFFNLSHFAP